MIQDCTIEKCKELIQESDVILIGAGSGLSTAAGLEYSGKRFRDNFSDYIERYQLTDMYSSGFYPYSSREEKWGYFSRHIKLNRYDALVSKVYSDLLQIVQSKEFFVITTNVDAQFLKADFNVDKVFATQGDYGKFQCEKACHDKLYDNEEVIFQMVEQQSNCRIPSELLPMCPVCGGNLTAHLRIDNFFVENEDWHIASQGYIDFVKRAKDKKLLMLELGVGFNTPVIIRWPFEQIANDYEKSTLIRVNKDNVQSTHPIPDRSVLVQGDITEFIRKLRKSITIRIMA